MTVARINADRAPKLLIKDGSLLTKKFVMKVRPNGEKLIQESNGYMTKSGKQIILTA